MRILHVPNAYHPVFGGTEIYCKQISEMLALRGHIVHVLTSDVSGTEGYYQFNTEPVCRNKSTENINNILITRISFCNHYLYRLGKIVSRQPSSRVASILSFQIMTLLQKRFKNAVKTKIINFRPDIVMTAPHLVVNVQCVLQVRKEIVFPLVMLPLIHEEWTDEHKLKMTKALQYAQAVIAVTDYEADQLRKVYRVDSHKVFMAGAGTELPAVAIGINRDRSTDILFLGRKVPGKGIQNLLSAMKVVWQYRPDVRLVLAGSRTSTTIEIDRAIEKLPLQDRNRVLSLDNVSAIKKQELLTNSTCLVLPSEHESFGIVLIEAMAHSTPVVTLDLPVYRSILCSGREGLLVPPGNILAMAQAILYLVQNPLAVNSMGAEGRITVQSRFTWSHVTDIFEQAYYHAIQQEFRPS